MNRHDPYRFRAEKRSHLVEKFARRVLRKVPQRKTGNLLANSLAAAFGAEPQPSPPAELLFVGCNYTPVSREEFLEMAGRADGLVAKATRDIGEAVNAPQTEQTPGKKD